MVVVSKAPIITTAHPIVNAQPIFMNPFESLGHSLGYNFQSIPMASIPFSYGMPNFTSHFSNSILVVGPNARIGLWGTYPPYTPFSFGGSYIPQMIPIMGCIPSFNLRYVDGRNSPSVNWKSGTGLGLSK
jgi:hypothetical protein